MWVLFTYANSIKIITLYIYIYIYEYICDGVVISSRRNPPNNLESSLSWFKLVANLTYTL